MDKAKRQAIAKGKALAGSKADKVMAKLKATTDALAGKPEAKATAKVKQPKEVKVGGLVMPKLPSLPKMRGERKPRPTKPCQCGCKTETQSMWAPGHDARARGWAIRIERNICKMNDVPEMERQGAVFMLKARKGTVATPIKIVKAAAAPVEQEGAALVSDSDPAVGE